MACFVGRELTHYINMIIISYLYTAPAVIRSKQIGTQQLHNQAAIEYIAAWWLPGSVMLTVVDERLKTG